jgi:hypothetical protein
MFLFFLTVQSGTGILYYDTVKNSFVILFSLPCMSVNMMMRGRDSSMTK